MNTTSTVSILFYKGPGTPAEALIRLWTASRYAHTEFLRSDGLCHSNDRFRFVSRVAAITINPAHWEEFRIELPCEIIGRVERRQLRKNGTGYDWKGIVFSQVFELGMHSRDRWFCSKSNADDLIYAYRLMKRSRVPRYIPFVNALEPLGNAVPNTLSPGELFRVMQQMGCIRERSD